MKWIYLSIFIITTTIHLIASLKQNKRVRDLTKGYILLSILGFYLEWIDVPSYLAVFAIIFSWLGDVFLIPHGVKWFTIGGIFFWISHGFFIAEYNRFVDFSIVPWWSIVLIGVLYTVNVVFSFSKLKEHLPKPLFYPMFFYLLTNGAMNAFAWFRLISTGLTIGSILTVIGAILFFLSDTSLFFVRFKKNSKLQTHFIVMLTYSIGEFLIILGLLL